MCGIVGYVGRPEPFTLLIDGYRSCAIHGCNGGANQDRHDWPSHVVDVPAITNRIFPWLSWKYKVEGELYLNTDEAFFRLPDPWSDQYLFGGNGDGTLFYPSQPDRIGGKTDIPIETVRLRLIREGLEDYAYLILLSKTGLSGCADEAVSRIARKTYDWDRDPDALYAARQKRGEKPDTQINRSKVNAAKHERRNGSTRCPPVSSSCLASEQCINDKRFLR